MIGMFGIALYDFKEKKLILARDRMGESLIQTPLPIFAALFFIVGVQLIVMGILAEMIMRTYYESRGKHPYTIREKINF